MLSKRLTALSLALILLFALLPVSAAAAETAQEEPFQPASALIGDADGDGVITISDATVIQRYVAEQPDGTAFDAAFFRRSDTNGDGVTGIKDATDIQCFCAEFANCGNTGKRTEDTEPPVPSTPDSPVISLTLNADTLTLGTGEAFPLIVTAEPALPPGATVTFSSGSEAATVTADGVIQAELPGVAVITCRCGESTAACTVTVCPQATSLAFDRSAVTLGTGERLALTALLNEGAAAYHRTYASGDSLIAAVSDDGVITATGAGTTTVTSRLQNGLQTSCAVTVKPQATALTLNKTAVTLSVGDTFDFDSYVPADTAAYYRHYYSEDPEVAAIQRAGGLLTATGSGKTRIYCEMTNGVRAYAEVTVLPPLRSLMLEQLRAQLGNNSRSYIRYINARSTLDVPEYFPWCAVFSWCMLDQFSEKLGQADPVTAWHQVSGIAVQARKKGALHNVFDNDYLPKPGDLFTTSTLSRPGDDGREHIGYVESVETDSSGKVIRVHTIEGNYMWETEYPMDTKVSRGVHAPGVKDIYGAALVEYIDLEALFR